MKDYKRILFLTVIYCLVLVMASTSVSFGYTSYSKSKTGKVTCSVLNVRGSASPKAAFMGTLNKNAKITLYGYTKGTDGDRWYRVKYKGKKGYVNSSYVKIQKTSAKKGKTSYHSYSAKKKGVVTYAVNLRKSASKNGTYITTVPTSMNVSIAGYKMDTEGSKWYKISYGGRSGYVISDYIRIIKSKSSSKSSSLHKYSKAKYGRTTNVLNMRGQASLDGKFIRLIPDQAKVKITGYKKDSKGSKWYKVTYGGKSGYAISDYIKIIKTNTAAKKKTEKKSSGTKYQSYSTKKKGTAQYDLNVRKSASTSSKVVTAIPAGRTVTLYGYLKDKKGVKWYKTKYSGKTGYVCGDYIKVTGTVKKAKKTTKKSGYVKYSAPRKGKALTAVILRSGASTASSILGNVSSGDTIRIYGYKKAGDGVKWYKTKVDGKTGYVCGTYISNVKRDTQLKSYIPEKRGTISANVYSRSKASASAKKQSLLKKGKKVKLYGYRYSSKGAKWYLIKQNGKNRYIRAKYVKKIKNASKLVKYSSTKKATAKKTAYIRMSVSSRANRVVKVPKGKTIKVTGYRKTAGGSLWYRATYGGRTGYIYSKNVTVKKIGKYVAYESSKKGRIKSKTNLRTNASTKAKRLVKIPKNSLVTIYGYKKSVNGVIWYKTKYQGKTGYVTSKNTKIEKSKLVKLSPAKKGQIKAETVLRKGPAQGYKKIMTLPKNAIVTMTGYLTGSDKARWYKVKYKGKIGYVKAGFVTALASKPKVVKYSAEKTGQAKSSTYIRSGASTGSSSYGRLLKSQKITVYGYVKNTDGSIWYRIIYGGKNAYIDSRYLNLVKSTGYTIYSPAYTGSIQASSLVVRSGPSTSNSQIGSLARGQLVSIRGMKRNGNEKWYAVVYNGKTGYIFADYVSLVKDSGYIIYTPAKSATAKGSYNVRKGASSESASVGKIRKGQKATILGYKYSSGDNAWYRIKYGKLEGFVIAKCFSGSSGASTQKQTKIEGFPSSYMPYINALSKAHPNWKFVPQKTGLDWNYVVNKESGHISYNLYQGPYASWRSVEKGAFDPVYKYYYNIDGAGWHSAYKGVIAYYLDPRNFLNEDSALMFMEQAFDSDTQSINTVKSIVKGTFMEGRFPESTYSSYAECIYYAGRDANVNPNVIASMIKQEQGVSGDSGLISGTYSKEFRGIYNFLNVGAYTKGGNGPVYNGLHFASGKNGDMYGRPWNTRAKSIRGGAEYYATQYVNAGQNTFYLKKFNVMNGESRVATHQYMSNIQAAESEARNLARVYDKNAPMTLCIPIYNNMPGSHIARPTKSGNNDNLLDSLSVSGYRLNPSFSRYVNDYTISVPSSVSSINVNAAANDKNAKIRGNGKRVLSSGTNSVNVNCISTSGVTRTYTITVYRK